MDKIIDTILNYVEPEGEINASSTLRADCGLTSFDMVCLFDELAAAFSVEVSGDELKQCSTVGDLAKVFCK